ncbi:glycosyltransferase [Virgibacillus sp. NKC19-3]|uniref:glycosyltransferase n=1 Tax=Virgibacillus saliphilus TaxID=2831674 RepID=UPI001C9B2AF7|nr:glycosyltransferase [Virgibacillus sp. NKC19-3]MBY7144643.1 glycosyltransferase [Virgibacillus sp. NKC19-3]
MDKLVSIIVPVYNVEIQLHDCIHSILNQTYTYIEVILVNDGSTDSSGSICDDFAKGDNRVNVIHQKNAGPSAARNAGIDAALGDYIQFVDSDDYMEPTMTETLLKAMISDVQLVLCGYQTINRDNHHTKDYIPSRKGVFQYVPLMKHIGELYKDVLLPSPCNKLYRAACINQKTIRFMEGLSVGEDLLFNLDYLQICNKVHVINNRLYYYSIADHSSLSRRFNKDLFKEQQLIFQKMKAFLIAHNCYQDENKHFIHSTHTNNIIHALGNLFHANSTLTSKEKKERIRTIVTDDSLKEHMAYFNDTLQKRIIGLFIRIESINGIYIFFKTKNTIQQKMHPLFQALKTINNN